MADDSLTIDINLDVIENKEAMDLSGDGFVTMTDFALIAKHWQLEDDNADLNESGIVEMDDLSVLVDYWLWKAIWKP